MAPNEPKTGFRTMLALSVGIALVSSACGSSADSDAAAEAEPTAAVEPDTSEATATAAEPEPEPADEVTDGAGGSSTPPDLTGLEVVTYPALGGLRVGFPADVEAFADGDFVRLGPLGGDGYAVVARISQGPEPEQITGIDQVLADVTDFAAVESSPTGETMTVLGAELDGYELRGDPVALAPGPGLFSARPFGVPSNTAWTPAPFADVYLGEVEDGVLAVGAVAASLEGLEATKSLLDQIVPTLHLTTADGTIEAVDAGFFETVGEPMEFVPSALDPEGAPELTQLFAPVEPGPYQTTYLSVPTSFEVPDGWWVMPNFPTFIVLADDGPPVSPGDRDVILQQSPTAVSGLRLGLNTDIGPIPLDDLEAFLADPPASLIVDNVVRDAEVGGLAAVRFDIHIDPMATCQVGDPCGYILTAAVPDFAKDLKAGFANRIWWVDDVPKGPIVVSASVPQVEADWLHGRAQERVDGIRFG